MSWASWLLQGPVVSERVSAEVLDALGACSRAVAIGGVWLSCLARNQAADTVCFPAYN